MPDLDQAARRFARAIRRRCDGPRGIYRNNWLHAVAEALGDNFPVVATLVGDEMFAAIAVDHANAHPPETPVLAHYGHDFADWLEEQGWSHDIPYLADVARFEWMHLGALFAADAPALDLDDIGQPDWLDFRPRLHPATRFGWATTPAMAIWLAHQDGEFDGSSIGWTSGGGLFTRPGGSVTAMALDKAAHRLLFGLRLGESVGTAAAAAHALYPDTDIGAVFTTLVRVGAFAAPDTP